MASRPGSTNGDSNEVDYSLPSADGSYRVKVICLGDSAVGKSKLVERYLLDGYKPHQLSTYALTMFRHKTVVNDEPVLVGAMHFGYTLRPFIQQHYKLPYVFTYFWDTAGQERFSSMHPSYYHQAHACIMAFDITRKITYKNLANWYKELREYRPEIPCFCAANKIDVDYEVTKRIFQFPKKYNMPLYFVSASDGTNVVKLFKDAINSAVQYKKNPTDFMDEIFQELESYDGADFGDEDSQSSNK